MMEFLSLVGMVVAATVGLLVFCVGLLGCAVIISEWRDKWRDRRAEKRHPHPKEVA